MLDSGTLVVDPDAPPVGLGSDEAVALEQVTVQGLGDSDISVGGSGLAQQFRCGLVAIHFDIEMVDADPFKLGDLPRGGYWGGFLQRVEFDLDRRARRRAQILLHQGVDRCAGIKSALVEGVKVKFERFRFDDVRGGAGKAKPPQRGDRFALGVKPGYFVAVPHIFPFEGEGAAEPEFDTFSRARHGEQLAWVVLLRIAGLSAEGDSAEVSHGFSSQVVRYGYLRLVEVQWRTVREIG